jgi:hypothetical protein
MDEARHDSSSPPLEGWRERSERRGGWGGNVQCTNYNVQIEFIVRCD